MDASERLILPDGSTVRLAAVELLYRLWARGFDIWAELPGLRVEPDEAITDEEDDAIREHVRELRRLTQLELTAQ